MTNRYRKRLGLLLAAAMIVLTLPAQAQKQPKAFTKWPAPQAPHRGRPLENRRGMDLLLAASRS